MLVATSEPIKLRAGDTWSWRREDLSDYPASAGWLLTYYFRNATSYFNVVAQADGDSYSVAVDTGTTSGIVAGSYDWVAVVANGSERYEVSIGRLTVMPDFSASAALDGRSFARRMLDAVEAALIQRATADQLDLLEAALADRSLKRSQGGLLVLRSQLLSEVAREEQSAGLGKNKLLVRFSNA